MTTNDILKNNVAACGSCGCVQVQTSSDRFDRDMVGTMDMLQSCRMTSMDSTSEEDHPSVTYSKSAAGKLVEAETRGSRLYHLSLSDQKWGHWDKLERIKNEKENPCSRT